MTLCSTGLLLVMHNAPSASHTSLNCRSSSFTCKLATGHQVYADPPSIAQYEDQLVAYEGTALVISPYTVDKQVTTVRVGFAERIESFTEAPGTTRSKSSSTSVVYKAGGKAEPFVLAPFRMHYSNNKPFLQIMELDREITVRSFHALSPLQLNGTCHADTRGLAQHRALQHACAPAKRTCACEHAYCMLKGPAHVLALPHSCHAPCLWPCAHGRCCCMHAQP